MTLDRMASFVYFLSILGHSSEIDLVGFALTCEV